MKHTDDEEHTRQLVHLVRAPTKKEAIERFTDILSGERINGGNWGIRGGYRCVCFSGASLARLTQFLGSGPNQKMGFRPLGIAVKKTWALQNGGRPVIHSHPDRFRLIPDQLRFRHVNYDPVNGLDHVWEKEWRIRSDRLPISSDNCVLVVPTEELAVDLSRKIKHDLQPESRFHNDDTHRGTPTPWRFLALETLGISVNW